MVIRTKHKNTALIKLLPNRSLNWQQAKYVIGVFTGISIITALFFGLNGAWPVLLFIGLVLLLFAFFLYRVCLDSHQQERLSISDNLIEVEWGKDAPKQHWILKRKKCEWIVVRPHHSLSAHEVRLKAGNKILRIGGKLSKEDVDHLIKCLEILNIPLRFTGVTVRHAIEGLDS